MTNELKHVNPPRARVGVGYTKNMGKFESLRVDFSYEESAKQDEDLDALVERLYGKAETKLIETVNAIEEELKNGD